MRNGVSALSTRRPGAAINWPSPTNWTRLSSVPSKSCAPTVVIDRMQWWEAFWRQSIGGDSNLNLCVEVIGQILSRRSAITGFRHELRYTPNWSAHMTWEPSVADVKFAVRTPWLPQTVAITSVPRWIVPILFLATRVRGLVCGGRGLQTSRPPLLPGRARRDFAQVICV